jgi:uncharacterized protein
MLRRAAQAAQNTNFRVIAGRALRVLVLAWVGVFALVYPFQRKLLFVPLGDRVAPEAVGLTGATEDVITTPDGERLISWTSPAKLGQPTILYFHGNAGSMAWRADRFARLQSAGYGVRMVGYRGFGGSSGSPSERGLIIDALAAYDRMRAEGLAPQDIILFGESLGTGVAVQLAAARPVAGVILDSPYTSTADAGAYHYPYLPVRWLMWDQFNSLAHIAAIRAPLLVVHGARDEVVPYALGQRLFAAAVEPKQFLTLSGEGHTAPLDRGAWAAIVPFVARVTSQAERARRATL